MTAARLPAAGPAALVIAGMHRSGTSLLASLFAAAGVSLGTRLIGASRGNDRGHWEDLDFYEFHARALRANGADPDGFTCVAAPPVPAALVDAAAALVEAKASAGGPWGWKDPRTVLFLDFWADLLPTAGFVLVFRSPWEVADSLFRRGDAIFAANPAFAPRIWLHYNRQIVDFHRRHPERSVLVGLDQVIADPAAVFAAVRGRLGPSIGDPPALFEEALLVRDHDRRRAAIVEALLPDAVDLHDEMRRLAGLPVPPRRGAPQPAAGAIAEHAVEEWARAAAAESASRRTEAEAAAAVREAEERARAADDRSRAAAAEARGLRSEHDELVLVRDALAAHVQRFLLGEVSADGAIDRAA